MDNIGKGLIYDPRTGEFVFDKQAVVVAEKIRDIWGLLRLLLLLAVIVGLGIWLGQ